MSSPASNVPPAAQNDQAARPPYDVAFKAANGVGVDWQVLRQYSDTPTAESVLTAFPNLGHTEIKIPAVRDLDNNETTLSVFQWNTSHSKNRPVILFAHGGGQVIGNRFFGVEKLMGLVANVEDIVLVSVGYRLAPAHRAPAAAHDCYAAAVYLADHADELGIDASNIVIYGVSGGAGPSAATCILARDRQYPNIRAQVLSIPMLDDRDHYASHKQFETGTVWDGRMNREAWDLILGPDRGVPTGIAVPGRASDLSNLPPTLINVGEYEVFRDSAVAFASRIWSQGGSCELHVWPGMYHAATALEPDVPISRTAAAAEKDYIERTFGLKRNKGSRGEDTAQASL